jgi:hypothetical protein
LLGTCVWYTVRPIPVWHMARVLIFFILNMFNFLLLYSYFHRHPRWRNQKMEFWLQVEDCVSNFFLNILIWW